MYATLMAAMQDAHSQLAPCWELTDGTHAPESSQPQQACSEQGVSGASGSDTAAAADVLPAGAATSAHSEPGGMPGIRELVIYGLGSPQDSRTSRYQVGAGLEVSGLG